MVTVREPGDVSHVGQDPGSARGADPVNVHQVRACRFDRGLQLGPHCLEPGIEPD